MSNEKNTAKNTGKTAQSKEPVLPRVYCGPSIKGVALQWTVYTDDLPESLLKHMEEVPLLKTMMVPVSTMADRMQALNDSASQATALFNRASELLGGVGNGI